jgi:hypothetical protein
MRGEHGREKLFTSWTGNEKREEETRFHNPL